MTLRSTTQQIIWLISSMILLLSINSCKKDESVQHVLESQSKSKQPLEKISYSEFIQLVKPSQLGSLSRILSEASASKKQLSMNFYGESEGQLQLLTDSILKLKLGDTVSYIFSIKPQTPRSIYFQNLTVQILSGKIKAFLATYHPSKKWIEAWKIKRPIKFEGQVTFNNIDLNTVFQLNKTGVTNSVMANNPNSVKLAPGECEWIDVYTVVAVPCVPDGHYPGTKQCAWVNENLTLEDVRKINEGNKLPYFTLERTTEVNCAAPDTSPPPGGSGGGGSTSPNPPPGYDPCPGGPTEVSSEKNTARNSILQLPPAECDPSDPNNPPPLPSNHYYYAFQNLINNLPITDPAERTFLETHGDVFATINNYLNTNGWTTENKEFIRWAVRYLNDNQNITPQVFINQFDQITQLASEYGHDAEFNSALSVTLLAFQNGSFDSNYAAQNIGQPSGNPASTVLAAYFNAQVAIIKFHHPNWSTFKVYWEASREMIHLALDVGGLVPVIGEVCDLTNGAIYTIQGDGINASLSFASAIPVAGWAAAGGKFAIKVVDATASGKTTLKWVKKANGAIDFGLRSQLRKTLKLAPGNPLQAHHIIPWEFTTNTVVKKAAEHGFHMNEALNGIGLAKSVHIEGMVHSAYNNEIRKRLNDLPANLTPAQAELELKKIITDVKDWILTHPNQNLNTIIL